jgi:hypothetical protein
MDAIGFFIKRSYCCSATVGESTSCENRTRARKPICLVEAHLFSKCGYGPSAYSQRTTIAAIDKCQGHFQQQRQFRALVARIAAAAYFSDAFNSVGRERIKRLASARSALGQFVRSSA